MLRRLILLLLLLLPLPAAAQQTLAGSLLEGSWGLRLDGSIIMRFDLEPTAGGWTGAWVKPTSFASDGQRFGSITMPAVERKADSGRAIGEWAEITFNDPRPGAEPDQFRIRLLGMDRAEMLYVGTGLPPFTLERVGAGALLGPFEEGRVYGGPPRAAVASSARPTARPPAAAAPATPPPAVRTPPPPTLPREESPVQGPADDRPPAMIGR